MAYGATFLNATVCMVSGCLAFLVISMSNVCLTAHVLTATVVPTRTVIRVRTEVSNSLHLTKARHAAQLPVAHFVASQKDNASSRTPTKITSTLCGAVLGAFAAFAARSFVKRTPLQPVQTITMVATAEPEPLKAVPGSSWTMSLLKQLKIRFVDYSEATKFEKAVNTRRKGMKPFVLRSKEKMPPGWNDLPSDLTGNLRNWKTFPSLSVHGRLAIQELRHLYQVESCRSEDFVNQFVLDVLRWFQAENSSLMIMLSTRTTLKLMMANKATEAKADLVVIQDGYPKVKLAVVEDKPDQDYPDLLAQLTAEAIAAAQGHDLRGAEDSDRQVWGILNSGHFMQVVYFDIPPSTLDCIEVGSVPEDQTKFPRLTTPTAKGFDFLATNERDQLGMVLGGILDLLEEEIKAKANEANEEVPDNNN